MGWGWGGGSAVYVPDPTAPPPQEQEENPFEKRLLEKAGVLEAVGYRFRNFYVLDPMRINIEVMTRV